MADQTFDIVGPDGTIHEFPVGMDPKRAAAIVRGQTAAPAAPAQQPAQPAGMLGGLIARFSGQQTPPRPAPDGDMMPAQVRQGIDAVKGVTSGVMGTVYPLADKVRGALGMERNLGSPDVQAAMTAPASFPGQVGAAIGSAVTAGPKRILEGLGKIPSGDLSGAAHDVIAGTALTSLPRAAGPIAKMAISAPVRTVGGLVGSAYGASTAQDLARSAGATEGQTNLAGDIGGAIGGPVGMIGTDLLTAPIKAGANAAALRFARGALKVNRGTAQKMSGAATEGVDEMANRVARTYLEPKLPNAMSERGATQLDEVIGTQNAARDAAIAGASQVPVPGSAKAQLQALRPVIAKYATQTSPQEDISAIRGVARDLTTNPATTEPLTLTRQLKPPAVGSGQVTTRRMADLTPSELNALNKGDNQALKGTFGALPKRNAEVDALKAVGGARRDLIEQAVPGTKAAGARLRDLIDLQNVADQARFRANNRDVVPLGGHIAAATTSPIAGAVSLAMLPRAQGMAARGLARAAQPSPPIGPQAAEMIRLQLLLQQLQQLEGRAP